MKIIRSCDREFIPASHEDPNNPGVYKKVIVVRDDLFPGRIQMINWARLPKASSFRTHLHQDMEEVFIIMHGEVEMVVSGKRTKLGAGDTVIVEPNEVHEMKNIGAGDAEYMVVGISGDKKGKTVVV